MGHFTLNAGQIANPDVIYYHSSGNLRAGFGEGAVLIVLVEPPPPGTDGEGAADGAPPSPADGEAIVDGVLMRLTFPGSNDVRPVARGEMPMRSHFLVGSDPAGWRTDVPSFREVVYPGLYDGIDLVYRADEGGLKYEFRCLAGSDPGGIEVAYEGIERLRLGERGEIVIETAIGEVRDSTPVSYELEEAGAPASSSASAWEARGGEVESGYVLRSPTSFGFRLDEYEDEGTLVIDPLVYSTTLGGGTNEVIRSVSIDDRGFAYVAGWTASPDFPVTPGAFQTFYGSGQHAFVAKLNRNGRTLQWATYLGGGGWDDAFSIQVDSRRRVYVAGQTRSSDFPVTNGTVHAGGRFDAWVAKLHHDGSALLFGSYLGGSSDDYGSSIAIDDADFAYVTGYTRSTDFAVSTSAFGASHSGGGLDAFVAKVDPDTGALVYFTFLGGRSVDYGWGIAVDSAGSAYVTGSTISTDFPVTAASFDPLYGGTQDGFIAKLSPDGSSLVYSAYLGGTRYERAHSIAVDPLGSAVVCGVTRSEDFPVTPGAFGQVHGGDDDGFVAKIDPTGSFLLYATYLGGAAREEARGIALDPLGEAYVTGFTASGDFPVTLGTFDVSHNGGDAASGAHLAADGSALVESSFRGGGGLDRGFGIAVRIDGAEYVAVGETRSADFPTTRRALDGSLTGVRDGFVVKFGY